MYYDFQKIDSYGLPIKIIVGARGIGKTFATKKKCCKKFLYDNKKFVWLRDTDSACDKLKENGGERFFSDIKKHAFKGQFDGEIFSETININDNNAGYLMSNSTFYNLKGNNFEDFNTIVFDEFIAEKGQKRNASRTVQFLNSIQTIGRLRTNYEIIMLANALDRGDEILELFDFKIKDYGFYFNKQKGAVLHYCENNPDFDRANEISIAGKLVKDTAFEDTIANNKFMDDTDCFFDKKPTKLKLLCIISDGISALRLYFNETGFLYVERDFNPNSYMSQRYVCDIKNVNMTYKLIGQSLYNSLKSLYANKRVLFANAFTKNLFLKIILKML